MLKTRHITRLTPESHETLLTILETLPGALFVLDDASIILYANASAQALLGATPETLVGNSFWRCAPQLVSTALYQAIQKTKQTRALTEVQYMSSVTQRWLHVHLSSTSGGLTLQFHEMGAPAERQEMVHQRESLYMEVLENVHAGIVFLTPEGIVLDLNKVPLDDAQIRREEVVGKPLVEGPWWSFSPPSQAQLRAAIKRASRGETVRFETPIHPREGMEFHLEVAITPHRDADHHVEYLVMVGIDITARKRAEAELHTLIDAIPQQVWTMRSDGYIDYYNQRWLDYTGLSTEQAQGDGWIQCLHPDDQQRIQDAWQTSRKTGTLFETEQRLRQGTSGAYHWFLARAMPMRDKTGQIIKWFGTCTDIHDKKQVEDEIRNLIDAIPQLVWTGRPDGYVDFYNQRWRDYTGLSTEEAQGKGWMQCTHPEDRQRVLETWQRAVQTGRPYEAEQRLRHGITGEYRWFLMQATPYTDAQGTILKYIGTCTDIHDKKRAEAELRALIDAIPQLVWMLGPDGSSEYGNQRWCDYTDMTLEQYQGDGWLQAIHPDDSQHTLTLWRHALETGEPFEIEYRLKNGKTGGYRWFLARALPVRDEAGQIIKWFGTCTDIHEKKQIEDDIRVLVDAIPQLVWIVHPDGSAEYANPRWCDYTGMTFEQYQGDGWLQAIHPDDQQRVLAEWQNAVLAGKPYEAELRLRNGTTGDYRWFLARGVPFKDAQGTILKWFGTNTDIDEQKQAEQRIKASEENWRVLAETVPQMVWTTRPNGQHEYINQRWCDYMGVTVEHMQSDRWAPLSFIHPDDREGTRALWQHALETGGMYEHEERFRNSQTGAYRWFLARAMPVRDEAGQILKWFGTCTDIEEQKQVEQQLKESQESLRVLAETVPQQVWVRRPDGLYEYTNQRWRDYTGLTLEHVQSDRRVHLQFIHPDDQDGHRVHMQHALDTGAMFEYEQRLRNGQAGEYRWFLSRAMPMRDEAGQIIKWFGTNTDIEEQKRTEEALRQSQERASVLMNSSIIGINIIEGEQIVDANDTFLRITGYTREDLRAGRMNWMHMTPPDYLARTLEAHQELATQQSTTYEKEYVCKDGSHLPVLVCGVVFQHHPRQAIAFVLDNSARKELEQRKDDFISMASHELRNPLAALKMQIQLAQKRLERQSHHEAATALTRVEGPVKQLERLIEELLDVSKIQAGRLEYIWETVDLDAMLHEVAETMQQLSTTHAIVVRGAAPRSLVGDKYRLGQVFTNLISNAIKYSPGAETVEMDLSTSEETVTIRVLDHGLGIPREQRDKIFERFYRAAGPRQRAIPGLGMGLYIVAEIVKGHGGTITVESSVGKGSTFTVTLPKRRDA
ncbi:PAS domain S-box protein [Ktedonobacter robiniae]|uniref:histidine kinase n=1 Tax=Ktedonobacter robiniae TaxID=2778365 RepID=A0ABQ3V6C6_9CHLR|nr:PAS domain S-box protein [Ktedonobacter robiniae]GHO60578.1 hypothetical protein KSB_90530 [Ktedonobacter robiniae]